MYTLCEASLYAAFSLLAAQPDAEIHHGKIRARDKFAEATSSAQTRHGLDGLDGLDGVYSNVRRWHSDTRTHLPKAVSLQQAHW